MKWRYDFLRKYTNKAMTQSCVRLLTIKIGAEVVLPLLSVTFQGDLRTLDNRPTPLNY